MNAIGEMSHQDIALGKWLAAALDDSTVCDEMKADIRAWFDQFNREFVIGDIEAI